MTTSRLRRSAAIVATTALLLAAELALRCPTATAQPKERLNKGLAHGEME